VGTTSYPWVSLCRAASITSGVQGGAFTAATSSGRSGTCRDGRGLVTGHGDWSGVPGIRPAGAVGCEEPALEDPGSGHASCPRGCDSWGCDRSLFAAVVKVVIAGGTGQVGGLLRRALAGRGDEVTVLSRRPERLEEGIRHAVWDGRTLSPWTAALKGADGVVNLAGHHRPPGSPAGLPNAPGPGLHPWWPAWTGPGPTAAVPLALFRGSGRRP
jgi:NAD(P)H-binding